MVSVAAVMNSLLNVQVSVFDTTIALNRRCVWPRAAGGEVACLDERVTQLWSCAPDTIN